MKIPIWGPERPRGYRLCNSSCWDRSPTRSWVQDPGQTRWRINLWVANAQQMRSAYHRLLCSWHCCSDSCSELQPNLNPIPTFPSHEEWSMIITCYQVQIMRGESPKVLSVSYAWSDWPRSEVLKEFSFRFSVDFTFVYLYIVYLRSSLDSGYTLTISTMQLILRYKYITIFSLLFIYSKELCTVNRCILSSLFLICKIM